MNAILGMTYLALNSPHDAEQRKYLRMVTSSAETLLQLINGLLDFSKIEAGKLELEHIPFSVLELVDETIRSFSPDVQTSGVRIEAHVNADVPSRLCGDPLRLRQVLVNVVGNAVKFTREGEIEVQVSRLDEPAETVALQFLVRDTGVGIPAGKHQSIFDAFEQADSSTTREYGGTGLGLAIASKIVGMMGGRMWVESQPGHGSSFFWTTRFARPALEEAGPPERLEQPKPTQAAVPLRILLAEDHDVSRKLMKKLLEMRGHQVTAVCNGRQALEEKDRHVFDVVLMDVHMSELDGLSATAAIRRKEQGAPPVPIVALTADAGDGLRERYLALGFTDYIAKPVKPEALYALIEGLGKPATVARKAVT
jgi:CheY-like chemotaxis protein